MQNARLIKVGGICALIVGAMQLGGNALHPPIPPDHVEALHVIAATTIWAPVHLVITVSYFMFIPFVIGTRGAFKDQGSPLVSIATPMVIVGASLGAAQISTHLTIFKFLADRYAQAGVDQNSIALLYQTLWPYSTALEIEHLIVIFLAALLFGIAMLQEDVFARWIGWMGVIAGVAATGCILVGKLLIHSRTGDIIFGAGLLPLVIWIFAIGVSLLKMKPPVQA